MSGNLFSNLLSLHTSPVPEENFFTEMIAGLMDKDRKFLSSWLSYFFNVNNDYSHIRVETQVGFGKLDVTNAGSRPDIVITLYGDIRTDYVFIESKISSKEGNDQLLKYANLLIAGYSEQSKKHLLFISKNYEPKDSEKIIPKSQNNVFFKQYRWHDFYKFLNDYSKESPSLLHEEILEFMRRKNMTEITRFTPATLSAISLFPDVFTFFQAVLDGEVTDQFSKLFNQKSRMTYDQLRWREYALRHKTTDWEYSIGFWMPETSESFPSIYCSFALSRGSTKFVQLISVLEDIVKETTSKSISWRKFDWENPNSFPGIELMCSLGDFIQKENHVIAVKHQLLTYLIETKRVLEKYPILI